MSGGSPDTEAQSAALSDTPSAMPGTEESGTISDKATIAKLDADLRKLALEYRRLASEVAQLRSGSDNGRTYNPEHEDVKVISGDSEQNYLQPTISAFQPAKVEPPTTEVSSPASQPSRRVMVLGLCTTFEVNKIEPDEQRGFLRRLQRVLLKTTSGSTMCPSLLKKDDSLQDLGLTDEFQRAVLSAFSDYDVDMSGRIGVRGSAEAVGDKEVISNDDHVDALLWIRSELLSDRTLDDISRLQISHYANNMRWRMFGEPVSTVYIREQLWQTLISTIMYLRDPWNIKFA